ncbi:hypothetical protein PVMG_04565 [Plasmodium vivax Mauritania I]|uniref:VIR protein n=1 Tax=Plasmodium vivax Mauritania I TaxID=1035515 RepID=A0A0J9T2U5_PLAVI|nr:hypothetical protein PVMG_04565 [Plasmodium vivax Mauritania I]
MNEEFWATYDEFDKTLDGDIHINKYHTFCDLIKDKYTENKEEQHKFCLKLVRNLGCYPLESHRYFDPNKNRCNILYYWIYNSVKNKQISNNLIADCFGDYVYHMGNIKITPKCYYHPYEDIYKEPMNMIILEIFQSTMKTVTDMLDMENNTFDPDLQKYICECVNIYKELNKKYCHHKDQKRTLTCSMLDTVKQTYNLYLSDKEYQKYKIPSLDNVEKVYTDKCMPSKLQVPLNAPRENDGLALPSLSENSDGQLDEFSSPHPFIGEKSGSSISSTMSTAVGTMAGASSIIALLYKVTQICI